MNKAWVALLVVGFSLSSLGTASAFDTTAPGVVRQLKVEGIGPSTAVCTWQASGDDNYTGNATAFQLRYSTTPIQSESDWENAPIACWGTPPGPGSVQCCGISGLSSNTTYYFAVRFWDEVDHISPINSPVSGTTLAYPQPDVDC